MKKYLFVGLLFLTCTGTKAQVPVSKRAKKKKDEHDYGTVALDVK